MQTITKLASDARSYPIVCCENVILLGEHLTVIDHFDRRFCLHVAIDIESVSVSPLFDRRADVRSPGASF